MAPPTNSEPPLTGPESPALSDSTPESAADPAPTPTAPPVAQPESSAPSDSATIESTAAPAAQSRPRRRGRRLGLFAIAAVAAALTQAWLPGLVGRLLNRTLDAGPYTPGERAAALHRDLFVADLHADSLLWDRDLLERGSYGHVDLPRMIEGGLDLQVFTIVTKVPMMPGFTDQPVPPDVPIRALALAQGWPQETLTSLKARALYQAERLHRLERRSGGRFVVITDRAGLDTFVAGTPGGPVAAGLLGIEGAHCLEGSLDAIDELQAAGVRMIGLVHFFDNALGGSAHGTTLSGLTAHGQQAVRRMEDAGITIDLAHASPQLIRDVLAVARRPVVVSHTGVRGTHDSPRNLSDEALLGVAKTDGVVGIAFFKHATGGDDLGSIVRALRYTRDRIGADHVALGSDFDGSVPTPVHAGGLPLLTEALLADGFTEAELKKILGRNLLRVLRRNLPAGASKR